MSDSAVELPGSPKDTLRAFPLLELPLELRLRIYEYLFYFPGRTLDLDPTNYRIIAPRLHYFLVNQQIHDEAAKAFFSSNTIRLFPTFGKFFNTKKPLLARLSPRYRSFVSEIELRLGPGWGAPPRCQNTDKSLGLEDCTSLQRLKVFIELDPSADFLYGFRGKGMTKDSYKVFSIELLRGIIEQVPSLHTIEIDAFPGVAKDAPMVLAIVAEVERAGKRLAWGPLRGWHQQEDPGQVGLEMDMASMSL